MTRSIHPDTDLGTVYLKVSELDRSIKFYEEIIGLQLISREGATARMGVGGPAALLQLEQLSEGAVPAPRRRTGLYHFAILVPTREALGLAVRNFLQRRVPIGQGDHLVSEAIYLSDPNDNGIEVYADRPRDTWSYTPTGEVAMATDPVDIEGLLALAGDKPWTGLPAGTVMGHVHLHVRDLQEAKRFYVDALGFDIVANYGGQALFVSAGGYHHHVGTEYVGGRRRAAAASERARADLLHGPAAGRRGARSHFVRARRARHSVGAVRGRLPRRRSFVESRAADGSRLKTLLKPSATVPGAEGFFRRAHISRPAKSKSRGRPL
ncbi:VOC family protein [Cohnella ginsengisoli]|uniref:VOC family protein n=1 Tax=Cohnella ginsengisoli TaxID=425004 RepID=UPI0030B8BFC2